jgi:adenosyl cobinamide kinase/adenosyl cobinamide phosphate guanylyltransferase
MGKLILLVGGQKSGKSSIAERLAIDLERPVAVVTPAQPVDEEFAARIERHQADRPWDWATIETFDLVAAVGDEAVDGDTVIVDALDTWLGQVMGQVGLWAEDDVAAWDPAAEQGAEEVLARLRTVAAAARARSGVTIVIAGQPGLGPHALGASTRRYVDLHGRGCRVLGEAADDAWLVVAGRGLRLEHVGL